MPQNNETALNEAIGMLSSLRESVEGDLKKYGHKTAETELKMENLSKSIADIQSSRQAELAAAEQMAKKQSDIERLIESTEKKIEDLGVVMQTIEKQSHRGISGRGSVANELFAKYSKELDIYLREGKHEINRELISDVCKYMATMSIKSDDPYKIELEAKRLSSQSGATKGYIALPEFAKKEHSAGINPEGGYFVNPERANFMITREFETSPMRQVANILNIGSDSTEIPVDDNEASSGGWVGEKDTRTETGTAAIGLAQIYANEQYAQPILTSKLLDDGAINIQEFIARKTRDIMDRTENVAFITGNGVDKPRGILSYANAANADIYERDAIGTYITSTTGVLDGDSVVKLSNGIKEIYQPRATWLMKRATWTNVITLKDGQGRYLINPMLMSDGAELRLMGKRVVFMDAMPTVASGNKVIAYGDFSLGYTIVDRVGYRVLRDEYTKKPYILFYTTKRTGGNVTSFDSYKLLQIA